MWFQRCFNVSCRLPSLGHMIETTEEVLTFASADHQAGDWAMLSPPPSMRNHQKMGLIVINHHS